MPAPTTSLLSTPEFQAVVAEWRLHVENGQDPAVFTNVFLECMRDPENDAMRQSCCRFANFMKPRSWAAVRAELFTVVDAETRTAFARPNAETFYEGFRSMTVEAIRDYWEQFLLARRGGRPGVGPGPKDWSPRAKECVGRKNICGDPLHRRCGRRLKD